MCSFYLLFLQFLNHILKTYIYICFSLFYFLIRSISLFLIYYLFFVLVGTSLPHKRGILLDDVERFFSTSGLNAWWTLHLKRYKYAENPPCPVNNYCVSVNVTCIFLWLGRLQQRRRRIFLLVGQLWFPCRYLLFHAPSVWMLDEWNRAFFVVPVSLTFFMQLLWLSKHCHFNLTLHAL